MRMSTCHPDRPHLAKGLCNPCYRKANYQKYGGSEPQKAYYQRNKERVLERQAKYREKNRDIINEKQRKNILIREYGLSEDDYLAMVEKQKGLCAICDEAPPKRKFRQRLFVVDHDHTTGKVRALLCDPCNLGIGNFKENIPRLQKAISYLENYKKENK